MEIVLWSALGTFGIVGLILGIVAAVAMIRAPYRDK